MVVKHHRSSLSYSWRSAHLQALLALVLCLGVVFNNVITLNNVFRTIASTARLDGLSPRQEVMQASSPRPWIAIISSYVAGGSPEFPNVTPLRNDLDHLINKACYAKMWGYDYIFNMTYGFDKVNDQLQGGAYWLDYGHWHRVPHIRDRLNDYDWVLYADIDYVINEMKKPLESFLNEWQLSGKHPSILVPKDDDGGAFTFSSFAMLVKNDPFGISVLIHHWMKFGRGLCEKGNLSNETREYSWLDSDQPGLWYVLTQAHKDFFPQFNNNATDDATCDPITGLIKTEYAYMDKRTWHAAELGCWW